jgi:hypothetical protein
MLHDDHTHALLWAGIALGERLAAGVMQIHREFRDGHVRSISLGFSGLPIQLVPPSEIR